ncbi:MAG: fibronectin type III-like domain-contianing protein, partial [Lachnospiraceae bacterium]|nr:fibronectin type III-like domain-contianing protein [Lachnospiraceae bacterium]
YTDFRISGINAEADGPTVEVSAVIRNTGKFAGKETLQVYVSCPKGRFDREQKSLAGFAKTDELAPGQEQHLSVSFDLRDHAAYDEKTASYVLEKGGYVVMAGSNSNDVSPAAVVKLGSDFTVLKAGRLFGGADFSDLRSPGTRVFDLSGVPVYEADLSQWEPYKMSAPETPDAGPVADLTEKELALMNIGDFQDRGTSLAAVIGQSAQSVAGAAGESCTKLKDKGIQNLIMADGPAGVRISRRYYEDSKGRHAIGSTMPETMLEMLPTVLKMILDREPKAKPGRVFKEQYCTAIPIATAIAQSWNTAFAEL